MFNIVTLSRTTPQLLKHNLYKTSTSTNNIKCVSAYT